MPPSSRWDVWTRPWEMICLSFQFFWETFCGELRQNGLAAITRLGKIQSLASAKLLSTISDGFIAYEDTTIVPSLVKQASGVILDLGPGPGNQIHRFDRSLVQYIYGIEPNAAFKGDVDAKLEKHGLRDQYKLIACGVEDSDVLRKEGIAEGSLDTVLCIQVLCAVDNPTAAMKEIYKLLKPNGRFIFWEHGYSRSLWTRIVQALWNPSWSTFVGCSLTRNVLADILNSGEWANADEIEEPEDPISLLPRIQGVLIKKATQC